MSKNNSRHPNQATQKEVQAAQKEVQAAQEISVTAARYHHHSGPIPDPITLERYEQILPGSAERILKMAEEQSVHRKEMEKLVIKSRTRDSLLGILFGFLIALYTVRAGTNVVIEGYTWSGTILGSTGLVGLVSVFIYGTRSARKERENKQM